MLRSEAVLHFDAISLHLEVRDAAEKKNHTCSLNYFLSVFLFKIYPSVKSALLTHGC